MIKVINDDIDDFLKFLDEKYPVTQKVYIHICEGFDTIQEPDTENVAFGMFGNESDHIYVAGDIQIEQILKTVAHEYKHFLQKYSSESYSENEAENFADKVYKEFFCDIRRTQEDCSDCGFCTDAIEIVKGGEIDE